MAGGEIAVLGVLIDSQTPQPQLPRDQVVPDSRWLDFSQAVIAGFREVLGDASVRDERREERIRALYRASGAALLQLEYDAFPAAETLFQASKYYNVQLTEREVRILHFYVAEYAREGNLALLDGCLQL
jgi:hypothetical protein